MPCLVEIKIFIKSPAGFINDDKQGRLPTCGVLAKVHSTRERDLFAKPEPGDKCYAPVADSTPRMHIAIICTKPLHGLGLGGDASVKHSKVLRSL